MTSPALAVQLRRTSLDVSVPYSLIFDMPMKFGLEFMSVICPDLTYAKWEFLNDVINKVYGAGLSVFLVDFERSNTRSVINGRELKTTHLLTVIALKHQGLNINLNMMDWNLFVVAFRMNLSQASTARQAVDSMAFEHPRGRGISLRCEQVSDHHHCS